MAHSLRKTPVISCCHNRALSEKLSKQFSNRRLRSRNRIRIKMGFEPFLLREVSNVWDFPSDGKFYCKDLAVQYYRK